MELTYTNAEARQLIANEHSIDSDCVRIAPSLDCNFSKATGVPEIAGLFKDFARAYNSNEKLQAIKAIKFILGIGLKDAKDITDLIMGI